MGWCPRTVGAQRVMRFFDELCSRNFLLIFFKCILICCFMKEISILPNISVIGKMISISNITFHDMTCLFIFKQHYYKFCVLHNANSPGRDDLIEQPVDALHSNNDGDLLRRYVQYKKCRFRQCFVTTTFQFLDVKRKKMIPCQAAE